MSQRVGEVVCVFPQDFRSSKMGCLYDTCLMLDVVSRTLKGLKCIYVGTDKSNDFDHFAK